MKSDREIRAGAYQGRREGGVAIICEQWRAFFQAVADLEVIWKQEMSQKNFASFAKFSQLTKRTIRM